MTPSQLLTRIKSLGIVDEKYISKIQKQIEDPDKVVKPKAIISYLLKKSQLTQAQATELLKPPTEDEMEVVQPSEGNEYDTGALIGDNVDVVEPVVSNPDATIMDDGTFNEGEVEVVDVQPIVEPTVDPAPFADPMQQGFGGQGLGDQGFGSGAYETQASGPQKTVPGFASKIDSKNQFQTKWLYIGFSLLGLIVIGIGLFYILLAVQTPDEMLKAFETAYTQPNYADAAKKGEAFLEKFPGHASAATVRAKVTHSILRGMYNSKKYAELIPQSDKQLKELLAEEGNQMSVFRDDLAVILPNSLVTLSERAVESMASGRKTAEVETMKAEYEKLKGFQEVIDNPQYITGGARKISSVADNLSKSTNNIRTIEGLIKKEELYQETLKTITKLRDEGETDEAFEAYRKLRRLYGDVGSRKPLRDLMLTISKKESELVEVVQLNLTPTQSDRPSSIESTIVLASNYGTPVKALNDEVVPFLIDGVVYGIDAGRGSIAWRRFVGFQTDNHPVALDEDRTLLSDLRYNDLICVKTKTGELIWRQTVEGGFSQPAVAPDKVVVSTDAGLVVELDSMTGAVRNAAKLPQPTSSSALIGQRDPYIYQVGNYSNIYAISAQTFECEEVYSLDHDPGSVVIPPVQWTGYLLVAENNGDVCNLHVFKPENKGTGLRRVQYIPSVTDGTVTQPMVKAGRSMLIIADNGQIQMMDIDPTSPESPILPLGKIQFGDPGDVQPMLSAEGSQVWLASEGIIHARIRRNLGTIERDVATEARDEFLTSARKLDDYVLHVRRRNESNMLTASLADFKTLKPVWSTDFGGELAGAPFMREGAINAISNQGDWFKIDSSKLDAGYADAPIRGSDVIENLQFDNIISLDGDKFAVTGPRGRPDLLYLEGADSKLVGLSPPADTPATAAVKVGQELLLASTTGHVARISPKLGSLRGSPFQPPVSPSAQVNWLKPVMVRDNIFAVASAESKGDASALFIVSTESASQVTKIGSLEPSSSFKNQIVTDGKLVYGVLDKDGNDALAAFSTEEPVSQVKIEELDSDCVEGPWLTPAGLLVKLDNDKLICFGTDMTKKWSIDVENDQFACAPEVTGANLALYFKSGKINLVNPESGEPVSAIDLGQPINHRPLREGGKMYLGGADGTVHVFNPQASE